METKRRTLRLEKCDIAIIQKCAAYTSQI
ncbi:uncharacterized protein G2W53_030211 [Senna tora]|uniref:Uncharacterized protein n=1 Tax=Senna tora TaxID=362788 RepID=A0A834T8V0_9FABA|nr:uncharacterized protein G2W53_030211 [Senna tora]